MKARDWLRVNGYEDVADLIDEVMNEWKVQGKKTRRNWWDVLAGGKNGRPYMQGGKQFPVLRAAQIRQRKKVTSNAICRNLKEEISPRVETGRWAKRED